MKYTIRIFFLFIFAAVILISSGVIMYVDYNGSRDSINIMNEKLMREMSASVINKSYNFLSAGTTVSMISRRITRLVAGRTDENALVDFYRAIYENYPQLVNFDFGLENGNFRLMKKMPDGSFSSKAITRVNGKVETRWFHENPKWKEIYADTVESAAAGYDPRTRQWYRNAMRTEDTVWTDAYVFYTDKKPGLNCSHKVYEADGKVAGAIGIAIGIEKLSAYLYDIRRQGFGDAFIVNGTGEVIALPIEKEEDVRSLIKSYTEGGETGYRFLKTDEIGNDLIRLAYAAYSERIKNGEAKKGFDNFAFDSPSGRCLAAIADFPEPWHWKMGIVVSEDSIMSEVNRNVKKTLAISIIILSLFIFSAIFISRRISGKLVEISSEMERIRDFVIEPNPRTDHPVIEIANMMGSLEKMKSGLKSFEKYIPAALVRDLIKMGREAELGGEKLKITTFFSDIKDFTTISESLPPEALVTKLSEYLSGMSRVIHDKGGVIDKFIGDSVMAFWGAPRPSADQAAMACRAALACQSVVRELGEKWRKEGGAPFETRIGINTGEAVIGNIGSSERLNYTAIGDNVNLASRLESMNKYYGTRVMISENTYREVKDLFDVRLLDNLIVKGKTKPILVYELLCEKGETKPYPEGFAEEFGAAVVLYTERGWPAALEKFKKCLESVPGDPACEKYIERCGELIKSPPGDGWTGAFAIHR